MTLAATLGLLQGVIPAAQATPLPPPPPPLLLAQVSGDNTLGTLVNGHPTNACTGNCTVTGGTQPGGGINLFHSFQDFSIPNGGQTYFDLTGVTGVQNILSRVTGGNPSTLLGLLGVTGGNANLLLLNPQGIVFGPNASLDVTGAFVATTANALQFGGSAALAFGVGTGNDVSLLTVNPSALLFNQINPTAITSQASLSVPQGQTLMLVGGTVSQDGGQLAAPGGRIELGGLAAPGQVGLTFATDGLRLTFPSNVALADILLSNGAMVTVSDDRAGSLQLTGNLIQLTHGSIVAADTTDQPGGDVAIQARRLDLQDGSYITASSYGAGQSGNLTVNATDSISSAGVYDAANLYQGGLFAEVYASGNASTLTVNTQNLTVKAGASISSTVYGPGHGGNLVVNVPGSIAILGDQAGLDSNIIARNQGSGQGGSLTINAGSLLAQNGGQVSVSTFFRGNGANLVVNVKDGITLDGNSPDNRSGIFAFVTSSTPSQGANVTINTSTLQILNGASVQLNSGGKGHVGNLTIQASDSIVVDGTSPLAKQRYSSIYNISQGPTDAGSLTITTQRLLVQNGGEIGTGVDVFPVGSVGGRGGPLTINASQSVDVVGISSDSVKTPSVIYVDTTSTGDAGQLILNTGRLSLRDGGQVTGTTRGAGRGGIVQINAADSIDLVGSAPVLSTSSPFSFYTLNGRYPSSINTASFGPGNAGDLTIQTGSLAVREGAQLSASTVQQGQGGNLLIQANRSLEVSGISANGLDGSAITATTAGSGRGGNVTIRGQGYQARISNGGEISTTSTGSGDAGNVSLTGVQALTLDQNNSIITAATTGSGQGGNVTIQGQGYQARISNGGQISTSSTGRGSAGNILLTGVQGLVLDQPGSAITATTAGSGSGGNVTIQGQGAQFLLSNGGQIRTDSTGSGNAGNISLTGGQSLMLDRGSILSIASQANGGTITLTANTMRFNNQSQIISAVLGNATTRGGNITLTADQVIALQDSDILASAKEGRGGDITLNTPIFFGQGFFGALGNISDYRAYQGNGQVDVNNAGGTGAGQIRLPSVENVQSGLQDLKASFTDSGVLIADSCIARRAATQGSFTVTGTGGLPMTPYGALNTRYGSTRAAAVAGPVALSSGSLGYTPSQGGLGNQTAPVWKVGDRIQEAQGILITADGRVLLAREGVSPTLMDASKAVCQ